MIKFVAFDWNGTIIADTKVCLIVSNILFKKLGHQPITTARFMATYDVPIKKLYLANGFTEEEVDALLPEHAQNFLNLYEPLVTKVRTRSGSREILSWVHENGIKTGLFSNHTLVGIELQLKRFGLEKYFDTIMTRRSHPGEQVGKNKIDNLRNFMRKKNYRPEEIVIVGDTREEIEIGKELGFKTVALTGGNHSTKVLRNADPDYLIHNLVELKKILKAL